MEEEMKIDEAVNYVATSIADTISEKVKEGRYIDMGEVEKNFEELKEIIAQYNQKLSEWYDEKYHSDKQKLDSIIQTFSSISNVFKELSSVSPS